MKTSIESSEFHSTGLFIIKPDTNRVRDTGEAKRGTCCSSDGSTCLSSSFQILSWLPSVVAALFPRMRLSMRVAAIFLDPKENSEQHHAFVGQPINTEDGCVS